MSYTLTKVNIYLPSFPAVKIYIQKYIKMPARLGDGVSTEGSLFVILLLDIYFINKGPIETKIHSMINQLRQYSDSLLSHKGSG